MSFRREYEPPFIVERLSGIPKFGHTDDVSLLLSEDGDDKKLYLEGLTFIGSLVAFFFLAWFLIIAAFKCLGKDRVGFLAGTPLERPIAVDHEEETPLFMDTEQNQTNVSNGEISAQRSNQKDQDESFDASKPDQDPALGGKREFNDNNNDNLASYDGPISSNLEEEDIYEPITCATRTTRVRAAYLISALTFVVAATLMVAKGLTNLQYTIEIVHTSANDIDRIAIDARAIIDDGVNGIRYLAGSVRDLLVDELGQDNFCPANPTLQDSPMGLQIRNQADAAISLLADLDDFVTLQSQDLLNAAQDVHDVAHRLAQETEDVDVTDWQALLVLIPYTIVPSLLMVAAILAMADSPARPYIRLLNWFLNPLFILMVIAICGVATGMIMGASINGDFCLPSGRSDDYPPPSRSVRLMLREALYTRDTFEQEALEYYVGQCPLQQNPFQTLQDYVPEIETTVAVVGQLQNATSDQKTLSELAIYCNRNFDNLQPLLTNMLVILSVVDNSLQRTLDLISCENVVPIYTYLVFDGACKYSASSIFWVFSCALVMGVCGLIMITLRSACWPTRFYDPRAVVQQQSQQFKVKSSSTDAESREVDDVVVPASFSSQQGNNPGGRPDSPTVTPQGFEISPTKLQSVVVD